jgi:hypothetical protein
VNPHDPNQSESSTEDFAALEYELRNILRPVDPPVGFADRILVRAQGIDLQAASATQSASVTASARVINFSALRSRVWVGSAIAAMLLVGVATEETHRMEQRRKAEEAQKQFEMALQVTDRALEHARQQLKHVGILFEE